MSSLRKSSLWLLACLLACCQKVDLTGDAAVISGSGDADSEVTASQICGTGLGTTQYPYTVSDVRSMALSMDTVWVMGYLVGTAPRSLKNAEFQRDASNLSNILLSSDSLCADTALCIPVELSSTRLKTQFALPNNRQHFRQCLLVRGIPATYLYRKGLRGVCAGLWLDGFDISGVAAVSLQRNGNDD